jgi:hypothetical protein
MNDTKRAYELLQNALSFANIYDDVDLRSYSGRYMYGKDCIGLDGNFKDIMRVLFKAAVLDPEAFEDCGLDNFSQDSMGLGSIVYWTHLDELEGLEFDDDDDDY